jgi:hypothetical protein
MPRWTAGSEPDLTRAFQIARRAAPKRTAGMASKHKTHLFAWKAQRAATLAGSAVPGVCRLSMWTLRGMVTLTFSFLLYFLDPMGL